MKKISCFVLSCIAATSLSLPAFAADQPEMMNANTHDIAAEINVSDLDDCRELTFEEVIAQDMERYNISYEMARNQLLAGEAEILAKYFNRPLSVASGFPLSQHSDVVQYYTYQKEFSYDRNKSFKGQMTARIVVLNDYGVHKVIQRVDSITTKRVAGLYYYDWIEQSTTSEIAANYKSVRIEIVGYFKVEVDTALEGSVDILGFVNVGGSVGGTLTYESEVVIKHWTYSVS